MSSKETVAQKLSAFVCGMDYEKLPAEVIDRLKDLLLDQLGCQLIGSTLEWNQSVYKFVKENKHGSRNHRQSRRQGSGGRCRPREWNFRSRL
jgi:2-methylcitrate dehydratase PrpD